MTRNTALIALAVTTACVPVTIALQAAAQDYTPAEGFYDLSDMPETGMYPQGGQKPGSGSGGERPAPQGEVMTEEVTVGPGHFHRQLPDLRRLCLASR